MWCLQWSTGIIQDTSWSFRPLAVASGLSGLFPCPFRPEDNERWLTRWTTAAYVSFWSGMIAASCFRLPNHVSRFYHLDSTKEYSLLFHFATTMGLPFVNFWVIACRWGKVTSLLERVRGMDTTYDLAVNTKLRRFAWKVLVAVGIDSVAYTCIIAYNSKPSLSDVLFCLAVFHFSVVRGLIPSQVLYCWMAITRRMDEVNLSLKRACGGLGDVFEREGKKILTNPRDFSASGRRFFQLCELTNDVSRVYGLSITVTYASFVIEFVTSCFFSYLFRKDNSLWFTTLGISWTLVHLATVYFVTNLIGGLPYKATESLHSLMRVSPRSLGPDGQQQVNALIQKMLGPPVQITAANFFAVNGGLLTSIAGSITTYLIVLVQFKDTEVG